MKYRHSSLQQGMLPVLIVIFLLAAFSVARCTPRLKKASPVKSPTSKTVVKNTPSDISTKARQQQLDTLCNQARKQFINKQYQAAIASANQVLGEDPHFYKAYNVRGIALCYSGNFNDGMNDIDHALSLSPAFGYARFNKALAYELYGHYDLALDWYNRTLQIGDNDLWSYYGMASIYGRRGDVGNTVKYLQQAIDLDPIVKGYAKDEKDFNNVRWSPEFQKLLQ